MKVVSEFIFHVIAQEVVPAVHSIAQELLMKAIPYFTVLLKKGCMPDKDNLQPIYFQHSPNAHYLE